MAFGLLLAGPCVLLVAPDVAANPEDPASAEALFRAARAAMKQGNYATACVQLEESYRLEPAPGTLLNLAICTEELGRLARAWVYFNQVYYVLEPSDPRVADVRRRVERLEARLPRLTIHLDASAAPGTLVFRDGVELGAPALGIGVPVDPGQHVVEVQSKDHEPARFEVWCNEGSSCEVTVAPGRPLPTPPNQVSLPDAAAAQPTAPASSPRSSRADAVQPRADMPARVPAAPVRTSTASGKSHGWYFLAAGGAALAVSAVSGIMVLRERDIVQDECENKLCSQAGLDAGDRGQRWVAAGLTALTVGVLSAGAGAYVLLTPNQPARGFDATVGWTGRF